MTKRKWTELLRNSTQPATKFNQDLKLTDSLSGTLHASEHCYFTARLLYWLVLRCEVFLLFCPLGNRCNAAALHRILKVGLSCNSMHVLSILLCVRGTARAYAEG